MHVCVCRGGGGGGGCLLQLQLHVLIERVWLCCRGVGGATLPIEGHSVMIPRIERTLAHFMFGMLILATTNPLRSA